MTGKRVDWIRRVGALLLVVLALGTMGCATTLLFVKDTASLVGTVKKVVAP